MFLYMLVAANTLLLVMNIGIKNYVTWNKFITSPIPTDIDKDQFLTWLRQNEIQIVIFNEQQFWLPILWAKEIGVKVVGYVDYYTTETIKYFGVYDGLICNTQRHMDAMKHHNNAYYVPWGTDIEIFYPKKQKPELISFFHSAGMNPFRKGTDIFIQAIYSLCTNQSIEAQFLIHSQVDIHSCFPDLKDKITYLEERNLLKIILKTVAAPGLYHLGDVYVYPSRLDGIGLTLAEAAACGLPAIATDTQPMTEFLVPGASWKIPVESTYYRDDNYYWPMSEANPDALSGIILQAIEEFSSLMVEKCRSYASTNFDTRKNFSTLTQILSSIIDVTPHSDKTIDCLIQKYEQKRYYMYLRFPNISRKLYKSMLLLYRKYLK